MRGESVMTQGLEPITSNLNKLNEPVQSYKLVAYFIRHGREKFNLSANANYVMITLLNFYNPAKKFVFPKHDTIAQQTGLSVSTIKRCIIELINAHLLIKSRKKNCNVYAFTNAVFELFNSSQRTTEIVHCEPSHDIKQNKENIIKQQQPHKRGKGKQPRSKSNVVAFSSNHRVVKIDEVPEIIRSNKKVKNPCAYWATLSDDIKADYLKKQQEKETRQKRKKEREEQERLEKLRQREEELAHKDDKPAWELYDREKALEFLHMFATCAERALAYRKLNLGCARYLLQKFDLNAHEIIAQHTYEH